MPMRVIHPNRPPNATSRPRRLPRLVDRSRYTDPHRMRTPTVTTRMPRMVGSNAIPARTCSAASTSEPPLVLHDGPNLGVGQHLAEAGHAARALAVHAVQLAVVGADGDELDVVLDGRELAAGLALAEVRPERTTAHQLRPVVGPAPGVATSAEALEQR